MKILLSAALCAALLVASPAAARSDAITFDLKNATRFHLTNLYISAPSTNDWEEDILGDEVANPGETVEVTIDDDLEGCKYDLRADFSDGDSVQIAGVDLCEADGDTITISE